jgi:S-adenosylmethionine:tRNA ribosyltransferase-isomerase
MIEKSIIKPIHLKEFEYELPVEKIAVYPLLYRDLSKLLIYKNGVIQEEVFTNIANQLPTDSLLVFNDTRVIQARLRFQKMQGAKVEIFCLEPINPSDYALSLGSVGGCEWKCLIGNLKRWKTGKLIRTIELKGLQLELCAELIGSSDVEFIIRFSWNSPYICFGEILEAAGEIPLPPYLNRKAEEEDKTRYQTVYAKIKGSVAAPTAGLHFTPEILDQIHKKGIPVHRLCLHVGAGTFKPVQTEDIRDHVMHSEHFSIHREVLQSLIDHEGPLIAVGTTSLRSLESIFHLGNKLCLGDNQRMEQYRIEQWDGFPTQSVTRRESLEAILSAMDEEGTEILEASTQILILPGYKFKMADVLITNFHQPGSTLLLLIAAFIGEDWKKVYAYALEHHFRFLSYGDSSILFSQNS